MFSTFKNNFYSVQNVDFLLERNTVFAQPDNVVLPMTVDEKEDVRDLSYRNILKARQTVPKNLEMWYHQR